MLTSQSWLVPPGLAAMHLLGVLLVAGARVQQAQLPRLAWGNNGFPFFISGVVMQNRQECPHRACECGCWLFGVRGLWETGRTELVLSEK